MNIQIFRWLLCSSLFLFGVEAFAQAPANVLSATDFVDQFERESRKWVDPIVRVATIIFWSLAIFEFVLTFGRLAIAGTDLTELSVEFIRRLIIISFGAWLLTNPFYFIDVIFGFLDTGNLAQGLPVTQPVDAGSLIDKSYEIVSKIFDLAKALNWYQIGQHLMLVVTAGLVLWGLATAAAQLLLVLCEMYIVITVGLLTLGMYSFELTREYPMKLFSAVIGTGMKLLTLQLIIALGFQLVSSWVAGGYTDVGSYMVMAGGALAFKELAVKVPDYIQSLFAGASSGVSAAGAVAGGMAVGGASIAAAKLGGKGAVGAGKSLTGAGMALNQAKKAAVSSGAFVGGAAGMAAGMAASLGRAGASMAKDGIQGAKENILKSTVGGRMATVQAALDMTDKADGATGGGGGGGGGGKPA